MGALRRRGWVLLLHPLLPIAAITAAPNPMIPTAGPYELQELRHTTFDAAVGAPGGANCIAQTTDGFLWIATPTGLFRYDGARFAKALEDQLRSPSVRALLAEPDGSLWIGYTFGGAGVLRNGHLDEVVGGDLPPGSVQQFLRSADGTLWIATTSGLARLVRGQWQLIDERMSYSGESPDWLGSQDGRLVVLTATATFLYSTQSGRFERRPRLEGEAIRYGIPKESAWRPDLLHTAENGPAQTLIDRTGSLWVSGYRTLLHYRWSSAPRSVPQEDHFTTQMGLSGDALAIFEDREGNVWVGTDKGVDRFSTPRLRPFVFPEGAFHPLLIPGEQGDVWLGRINYPLIRLTADRAQIPAPGTSVTAAFRDQDGTLWAAGRDAIFQYAHGSVLRRLPSPVPEARVDSPSITQNYQAIAVDADGAVWLSVAQKNGGLFRWSGGGWTKAEEHYRLPHGPAVRLLVDARHRLWIAYPNNQLAIVEGNRAQVFTAADGLKVGNVLALDVEKNHAWIAGDRGVAALIGTRFVPLHGTGDVDFRLTSGVVETSEGELWLNSAEGVYRIPSASVRNALAGDPGYVEFELFNGLDGLDSPVEVLRPGPTMLRAPDGRLWLTRREGVWSIDPNHIPLNPVAPIVSIEDLICNGIRHKGASEVKLPAGSRNLQIEYTATSLTQPERVRFRYRLQGVDEGWQEVGQRREAYYTNLSPGAYEFQVMAANEDGVWSKASALLRFKVMPAFYQRLGFKITAAAMVFLLFAVLFYVRLNQLHKRYRRDVEARHAERERIARDIHDTLLQGVQALLFRLQMWEDNAQVPAFLRTEIAAVASQTKSIVLDGRERIVAMRRTDATPTDLGEALGVIGHEAVDGQIPAFKVDVVGEPKTLTADAEEQLLDIAREAVRNAYLHAMATRIVVTLEYRRRSLILIVADDGRGFDPPTAQERVKTMHFGLLGMRERARQLRAQFHVNSSRNAGTRIEVVVPAKAVYRDTFRWPWQSRSGSPTSTASLQPSKS
ncbi:MAG TPA: two-component regulator propeller domain-containing protein [Steroidobacteraceae bacterium]|nr:two-component regulator propeller domain-containing protein [Steroidobacteraceae bacterium]